MMRSHHLMSRRLKTGSTVFHRVRSPVVTVSPCAISLHEPAETVSQIHLDSRAAKLNSFRLCVADRDFHHEDAHAIRPLLHPIIRLHCESAGRIVPAEADPNRLRVGGIAVAETLAVVVVKREGSVRTGKHA